MKVYADNALDDDERQQIANLLSSTGQMSMEEAMEYARSLVSPAETENANDDNNK